MPSRKLTSLLVGAYFRPPAKLILSVLPAGTPLILQPEPENPYDAAALRVLVLTSSIPEASYPQLDEELLNFGSTLLDLLSQSEIWLGYIASTGGKPLRVAAEREASGLVGNQEFSELLLDESHQASLSFDGAGEPLVILEVHDFSDDELEMDFSADGSVKIHALKESYTK